MAAKKKAKVTGRQRTLTAGVVRLQEWLSVPGNSQEKLGERIGVSQPCVGQWLSAYSRPTHHRRLAIEKAIGIPASSWMTDDERRLASTGDARRAG